MKNGALYLLITTFILLGCNKGNSGESQLTKTVEVYAASGSRYVTEIICKQFEKENNCKVEKNFASSGILARQIMAGADPEIYISANKQWIDYLRDKGIVEEESIHQVASNSLVVVSRKESKELPIKFEKEFDINSVIKDKIAIGDPNYVPVGKYSSQVFEALGWSEILKEKMVLTKDVTSILHMVELGEVDWGLIYKTEAQLSTKVNIISEVPNELHQPIIFYIAELKNNAGHGERLLKKFCDASGQKIFKEFGFDVVIENSLVAGL